MIFQNRRSALQGRTNRSCCECQRSYYQMKRADNPHLMANGLSALRLCVWLFDNCHIKLLNVDESFLFTLRAIKRKIFKHCI